jgi:hypothetical protein
MANTIIPKKWSVEWFDLTTTDELLIALREAKEMIHPKGERAGSRSLWQKRIRLIEEELAGRDTEQEDRVE